MESKDGGHAFPQHGWSSDPEVLERMKNQGGMTLRDYFAAQTLISIADGWATEQEEYRAALAKQCYRIADAMLVARQENPESADETEVK